VEANVICLCPDDHVRFDYGAIVISDSFDVVDALSGTTLGHLHIVAGHEIDVAHVLYHREHFRV